MPLLLPQSVTRATNTDNYVHYHELLTGNPLLTITTIQSYIDVNISSYGNDDESEKDLYFLIHFIFQKKISFRILLVL
jgi:hypothetical protein